MGKRSARAKVCRAPMSCLPAVTSRAPRKSELNEQRVKIQNHVLRATLFPEPEMKNGHGVAIQQDCNRPHLVPALISHLDPHKNSPSSPPASSCGPVEDLLENLRICSLSCLSIVRSLCVFEGFFQIHVKNGDPRPPCLAAPQSKAINIPSGGTRGWNCRKYPAGTDSLYQVYRHGGAMVCFMGYGLSAEDKEAALLDISD